MAIYAPRNIRMGYSSQNIEEYLPMLLIIQPVSFITGSTLLNILSFSTHFIFFPLANIIIPCGMDHSSKTICNIFYPFPYSVRVHLLINSLELLRQLLSKKKFRFSRNLAKNLNFENQLLPSQRAPSGHNIFPHPCFLPFFI